MLLCAVTPYNDYKIGATYLAGNQFPVGALFVLFCLAGPLNALLRRVAPRLVFTRAEQLTIWTLILVASGLPSSGLMRFLLPHIAAPQYFSNGANSWEARVWSNLPEWFLLSDRAAAEHYYTGYPLGQERIPWEAWWRPLMAWGAFGVCFFTATFCLASLLRRQWIENEKFVFPLVALPLLLADDPRPGRRLPDLLYQKSLWIGVALTTVLHTLNGLHLMYPTVPGIRTTTNLEEYLTAPPWNQIGLMPMTFFPVVTGLSYLLAAEVSFSLWFFFLFYKAELLLAAMYNANAAGSFGSPSERQFHALQGFGGAIALLLWTLYTARRHLRNVWNAAMGDRDASGEFAGEMLSPRGMLGGLLLAYVGMGVWLYLATIPPILIAASLLTVTVSLVTLSWLVTQAGTLYTIAPCMTIDSVGGLIGTQHATPGAWYMNQRVECMFYRDTRELLLPEVLSGAKAAEASNAPLRKLFIAMVASVVLGVGVSLVASLWLPYYNGGANSLPNVWAFRTGPVRPLQLAGNLASTPMPGGWWNAGHLGGGFVGVLLLLFLRTRTALAPHPIGFIAASTISGRTLWFSILLGWLCKTLLLRFTGMGGYRAGLPFFIGLVLGDILNAVFWIILGSLTGIGYNFLPQ
jgi:hypothetical protein